MTTVSFKLPTIDNLIQQQKQLSLKLLSPQPIANSSLSAKVNYDRFKQAIINEKNNKSSDKTISKNVWQEISESINQAKKEVDQLASLPSYFKRADSQNHIARLRIQVEKNKLQKLKLQKQKRKIQRYSNRQKLKLDELLNEMQRLERDIKIKGIKITEQPINQAMNQKFVISQYPSVESLLTQIGLQNKQKYLEPIRFSHYTCKPIQFFQNLASYTMETEKQILFTNKVRMQEDEKLDKAETNYKKFRNSNEDIGSKLHKAKRQEQTLKQQLNKIQADINLLKKEDYVQKQLNQRIKTLKYNYEQQRKKKHIAILKLCKLVQLSGNQQAIKLVDEILQSNGIKKQIV